MSDIFIVDDELDICKLVKEILEEDLNLRVKYFLNASSLLKALANNEIPKLIILDIWLEGSELDGLGLLKLINGKYKKLPILVISGHGTISTAVKAIKLGAYNFIEKPFKSSKLTLSVKRALENARLRNYNEQYKKDYSPELFIGNNKKITQIKNLIEKNFFSNNRILITGEKGTGKHKLARIIHEYYNEGSKLFITLNSSSNSEIGVINYLNSEKFKFVDEVTIYVKNVEKLSAEMQKILLDFLTCKNNSAVDLSNHKLICSSVHNFEYLMESSEFNKDLLSRISTSKTNIPPLRDRKEDIALLAKSFFQAFCINYGITKLVAQDAFYKKLLEFSWDYNVLQLKVFIEFNALNSLLTDNQILDDSNFIYCTENVSKMSVYNSDIDKQDYKAAKKAFEKKYISQKIIEIGSNITQVAKAIGIERQALHKKIKDLEIDISQL